MAGTLHLVAVPIGHPDDITVRALRLLQRVDLVAAEDTRTTAALLAHHGVSARLTAFHDHNEQEKTPEILERLRNGADVALVSEAGTPLVNDPGFRLVQASISAGIGINVLPGACAAIAGLVGAGLPVDHWLYVGFFPRSQGERRTFAEEWGAVRATLIAYESPQRLAESLEFLAEALPGRPVCVARNLTKEHQQWIRGTAEECRAVLGDEIRGEVVLLLGPPPDRPVAENPDALIQTLLNRGLDPRTVRDEVASACGLTKREAYRRVLQALGKAPPPE
jgi:16S rRNA (cytidine1402-2'-O)-methyltransferase